MIKNILYNFRKYSFLLSQMILRDFKVKYKRSVLGVLWSLLYPVLMMGVLSIIFSQLFKLNGTETNFLVYLMTGLVLFNYFSEATSTCLTSIISNFPLLNKVYLPKYIFPLSKCLFVGINFLLSLIPLLIIIIITGAPITVNYLLLPYAFICLFIFTIGIGFLLSALSVFLKDMIYIYGILLTIWQYFTPIFYDISILPAKLQSIFVLNPLYQFLLFVRVIILEGKTPAMETTVASGLYAVTFFIIGCLVFKKNQDKFIYHL